MNLTSKPIQTVFPKASTVFCSLFFLFFIFIQPALADYSGVYLSEVRGDRVNDGLIKIEETGSSVTLYMEWTLPDPLTGSVSGNIITLDAGMTLTFAQDGLSFTGTWAIGGGTGTISGTLVNSDWWRVPYEIAADSSEGFSLPYVLYIPYTVERQTTILVENLSTPTHTDDMSVHLATGLSIARDMMDFARDLKTPLLVPIIPHTADNHDDFQGLGRGSLTSTRENLVRVDLQLIAMIENAREILSAMDIQAQEKVFMDGFSHSGQFTNRFTILHPERVQAAVVGAPGGWPVAPLSSWNTYTMNYPVGIADLNLLIGESFNEVEYVKVPQYFYMGADDTNDAIGRFTAQEQVFLNGLGTTPYGRWPDAQEMYDTLPCNTQFVAYPGVEHTVTDEMWEDIASFFTSHLPKNIFPWNTFIPPMINMKGRSGD